MEQARRELRGAFHRDLHVEETIGLPLGVPGPRLAQVVDAGGQGGEHVVEVVGDAEAEAPHRHQPLALEQLPTSGIVLGHRELELGTETQTIAETQGASALDALAVDEGAVAAAEILHAPDRSGAAQPRVAPRHVGIVDAQLDPGGSSQDHLGPLEEEAQPEVAAAHDHELDDPRRGCRGPRELGGRMGARHGASTC